MSSLSIGLNIWPSIDKPEMISILFQFSGTTKSFLKKSRGGSLAERQSGAGDVRTPTKQRIDVCSHN